MTKNFILFSNNTEQKVLDLVTFIAKLIQTTSICLFSDTMVNPTAVIIMATLIVQAICAPQLKKQMEISSTIRSAANLSLAELKFIVSVRNGENAIPPKTLTPCARAILACCKESVMNESCSENLKCGAYFFDVNPCDERFVIDALNAARTFYEQFNQVV